MFEFAMELPKNEYRKIRRYALQDDYLALCLQDGMSIDKINLCECMHKEVTIHGELVNFQYK